MEFIFRHVAGNAAIFLELSEEVIGRAAGTTASDLVNIVSLTFQSFIFFC